MSTKRDILEEMLTRNAESMKGSEEDGHCCGSDHCWHAKRGAIWMVVKDGHVIQECCRCPATRSVHADHAHDTCLGRDGYKLGRKSDPFKLYAGGPLGQDWTSDFERGRQATKFRF